MSRSYSLVPILVALLAGAPAAPASAQASSRGHKARPAEAAAKAATAEDGPALPPGEIRVKAESYEQVEKGRYQARGTVDLRMAGMRIQADKADVFEDEQPDGSVKRRLVAEGNVVFIRGEERLSGDRMEMDDTGHGFFENAVGYVEPGVFVEGRRVERVDDKTYRVQGGKFTSCAQPNPRWKLAASAATIKLDDRITATNAVFEVKGVPAFYTPYLYYPIRRDGRSTGLLFPHFGHSSYRGWNVGTGFFWAMSRSTDQTFYVDSYSKLGFGLGHELRYMAGGPSRGTFRTYLFDLTPTAPVLDPATGAVISPGREHKTDYDLDWNALQMLPGKVRVTLNVRQYSSLSFNQRFQDSFNQASSRTKRWSGALEHDFGFANLNAHAETLTTAFGDSYNRVQGRLPGISLRRYPRPVGWGGIVFGLDAGGDRLRYGTEQALDTWSRWDFAPTLARPFALSFLEFNPSVGYRYTRYGASLSSEDASITGPPVSRSFFETSLDMRGPTFSRVFDTPGLGYSERFKHTIGPEVSFVYRTRVDDFNAIPKFDGTDYYLGTNEIRYSLVQRIFAKRRGPTGKSMPYEFFRWTLMQTYYAQISQGQGNYDPNYSSSAFGPGFKPEHLSPIMSRWRVRPTPAFSLDYQLEYDVNFNQVRRQSASTVLNLPLVALQATWSRAVRLAEDPKDRIVGSQTVRGNATMELLPRRLFLEGSADYDLVSDTLYQLRGQLRYAVQCCGFSVEHIRYNWNGRNETQWRFNLQLANIGSMGNFLGVDATGRSGLAGYR